MKQAQTVIVPVKPPVPGSVKTRLSAIMSPESCARISYLMLLDLLDAHSTEDAYELIVVTEAQNEDRVRALNLPVEILSFNSVGGRPILLKHAFQKLFETRKEIVSVFADTPFVFPSTVKNAFDLLDSHDVVIGKDSGPGYYLLGLSNWVDILSAFATEERRPYFDGTLDLCQNEGLSVAFVSSYADFDSAEDIAKIDWTLASQGWFRTTSFLKQMGLLNLG